MMQITAHKCRHGTLCHYAGDQVIGASLRVYGEWAEEELYVLHSFIQPNSVIVDVGANVGTHSLAFARFVGPNGRVIALEGQRRAADLLVFNMLINDAMNVSCVHALVGAAEGSRMLPDQTQEPVTNLGGASFSGNRIPGTANHASFTSPVPLVTLDRLSLRQCNLIKIDVEGMELDVLRGATATIAQHRPIIYFEQTGPKNFAEIFALLRDASYQLFWHVADPFNKNNYNGYDKNIFGGTKEVNVLSIPREQGINMISKQIAQAEIIEPIYNPDVRPNDVAGWMLPEVGYDMLAPTTFPAFTQIICAQLHQNDGQNLAARYTKLQSDYQALAVDRQKAQQIMEHQLRSINELRSEIEKQRVRGS